MFATIYQKFSDNLATNAIANLSPFYHQFTAQFGDLPCIID
ncbi:hypothetical protein [Moraxella marmotae]